MFQISTHGLNQCAQPDGAEHWSLSTEGKQHLAVHTLDARRKETGVLEFGLGARGWVKH